MYEDYGKRYLDSKLYLQTVNEENGEKCYQFLWVVDNYGNLELDIRYVCHCICFGGKYYFLQIKREDSGRVGENNRCIVDLWLGISPCERNLFSFKYKSGFSPCERNLFSFKYKYYSDSNTTSYEQPFFTPNGHLKVICEITISSNEDLFLPLLEVEQSFKVYKHMEEMFNAGLYTDLSISVGEKIFNVHKAVIATRSKVFEAMLEADMKEKAENKIVVEDCESEIFGEFLRYIYSNKLSLSNVKSAVEFYKLSEKYGLPDLKVDSSIFLVRNLTADNVIRLQKLSDLHEDSKLKEATIDYMSQNLLEVMKSSDWSSFRSSTNEVDNLFLILGKYVSEDKVFKDFRPQK